MTFKANKCSHAQSDVIQHRAKAALRPFNQTLLLQTAMIHFNPPRKTSRFLASRLAHFLKPGRPMFRRAVRSTAAKHFDFSKTFKPHDLTACFQSCSRDGLQPRSIDIDLPVRFEPGQKMPTRRECQLQVFNRAIPTIETDHLQIEPAPVDFE